MGDELHPGDVIPGGVYGEIDRVAGPQVVLSSGERTRRIISIAGMKPLMSS